MRADLDIPIHFGITFVWASYRKLLQFRSIGSSRRKSGGWSKDGENFGLQQTPISDQAESLKKHKEKTIPSAKQKWKSVHKIKFCEIQKKI